MSEILTPFARVEYLVRRRFPNVNLLRAMPSLNRGTPVPDTTDLRAAVIAYRTELGALRPDELMARYNDEQAKEGEEIRQKLDREERERFFNRPHAVADYDHWSKAAHWTLDEAIALSFGKAPEVVRWDTLKSLTLISPFAIHYSRRRDLALRAAQWKQLFDPVLPGIFLAWSKRLDLDVAPELAAAIQRRGVQVADWKSLYEEAQVAHKEKEESWTSLLGAKDQLIASLESRIGAFEEALSAKQAVEKPLGARERESLLKLVIGMACGGYGYESKAKRSEQTTAIADDLLRVGVPLDADTVRKWLREATEFLPPT